MDKYVCYECDTPIETVFEPPIRREHACEAGSECELAGRPEYLCIECRAEELTGVACG